MSDQAADEMIEDLEGAIMDATDTDIFLLESGQHLLDLLRAAYEPGETMGIVNLVMGDGSVYPAAVISRWPAMVRLDIEKKPGDNLQRPYTTVYATYNPALTPGTWHWPSEES